MIIEIKQNEQGCDVVEVNGKIASDSVTCVVLKAVEKIEFIQDLESNSYFGEDVED